MELFQLTAVLLSGGHDIDSGCFYNAMAQNIRKLCDIFTDPIEASGKEFAKIMGKHLSGVHIGSCAKPLHLCPYITAVQRFAPRVMKIAPSRIFLSFANFRSRFFNRSGTKMVRVLFLQSTLTSPARTASTVK